MKRSDDFQRGCRKTGCRETRTKHTTAKLRKGAGLFVFFILLCALLTGCGGGEKTAGEAEQETAEHADVTVRIGVLQIADSFPLYVAEQKGLFEKHGVDVEIIEFQSASDQSVAYEAGELDGMMTDMIVQSLVNKSSAEDRMKTVAMAFGGDASEGRFLVASSPDSGIMEPSQLAGKKIGISENTMMEYLVGSYLEDLGIDLSTVELVNIPKLTLRLDLLMEGSDIQAAILPDPLAIEAESRGCFPVIDDTKLGKNYSHRNEKKNSRRGGSGRIRPGSAGMTPLCIPQLQGRSRTHQTRQRRQGLTPTPAAEFFVVVGGCDGGRPHSHTCSGVFLPLPGHSLARHSPVRFTQLRQ